MKADAIRLHFAHPDLVHQQQIELLKGVRHAGEKAVLFTPLDRRKAGPRARAAVVDLQQKHSQSFFQLRQCQVWPSSTSSAISFQIAQQHFVESAENRSIRPRPCGLPGMEKDQAHLQIGTHLLQMTRREIRAVIRVKHLRNPADRPSRLGFKPDALPKRKTGAQRARGAEVQIVPGDAFLFVIALPLRLSERWSQMPRRFVIADFAAVLLCREVKPIGPHR